MTSEPYNSIRRDPEIFGIKFTLLIIMFFAFILVFVLEMLISIVYDTRFWGTKIAIPVVLLAGWSMKKAKFGAEMADIMRYFSWFSTPKLVKGNVIAKSDLSLQYENRKEK